MCGRYYVNEEAWKKVREDFWELRDAAGFFEKSPRGDITPAMPAVSLAGGSPGSGAADASGSGTSPVPAVLTWGFPGFDGKKLIINARAEGIAGKPTFAESIHLRRCVLPAAGFYEWDRKKEKVTFTDPDAPVIYLAGIWRPYGEEKRFVVITREANDSMLPVHDRMPLMIAAGDVRDWLFEPGKTEELLGQSLPQLDARRDYEQLSLF